MGTLTEGTAVVAGRVVAVHADFASDHVVLRGGLKGEHGYANVAVISSSGGVLRLQIAGSVVEFPLEAGAERIAARIRNPPTLLDKLGLQPGQRVQCIGLPEPLQREVEALGVTAARTRLDALLLGVTQREGLERIPDLRRRLAPGGFLWVLYVRGEKDPTERDVLAAGRAAGLKDVKVARVGDAHTGLKFVVPRER